MTKKQELWAEAQKKDIIPDGVTYNEITTKGLEELLETGVAQKEALNAEDERLKTSEESTKDEHPIGSMQYPSESESISGIDLLRSELSSLRNLSKELAEKGRHEDVGCSPRRLINAERVLDNLIRSLNG